MSSIRRYPLRKSRRRNNLIKIPSSHPPFQFTNTRCHVCHEKFKTFKEFNDHYLEKHNVDENGIVVGAEANPNSSINITQTNAWGMVPKSTLASKCRRCNFEAKTPGSLGLHDLCVHRYRVCHCVECGKKLYTELEYATHKCDDTDPPQPDSPLQSSPNPSTLEPHAPRVPEELGNTSIGVPNPSVAVAVFSGPNSKAIMEIDPKISSESSGLLPSSSVIRKHLRKKKMLVKPRIWVRLDKTFPTPKNSEDLCSSSSSANLSKTSKAMETEQEVGINCDEINQPLSESHRSRSSSVEILTPEPVSHETTTPVHRLNSQETDKVSYSTTSVEHYAEIETLMSINAVPDSSNAPAANLSNNSIPMEVDNEVGNMYVETNQPLSESHRSRSSSVEILTTGPEPGPSTQEAQTRVHGLISQVSEKISGSTASVEHSDQIETLSSNNCTAGSSEGPAANLSSNSDTMEAEAEHEVGNMVETNQPLSESHRSHSTSVEVLTPGTEPVAQETHTPVLGFHSQETEKLSGSGASIERYDEIQTLSSVESIDGSSKESDENEEKNLLQTNYNQSEDNSPIDHNNVVPGSVVYCCMLCDLAYRTKRALNLHIPTHVETVLSDGEEEPNDVQIQFPSITRTKGNKYSQHSSEEQYFCCLFCDGLFTSMEEQANHMSSYHQAGPQLVSESENGIPNFVLENRSRNCLICKKIFPTAFDVELHKSFAHGQVNVGNLNLR